MIIKTADFLCSSQKISQCPEHDMIEFAFLGRSNVGKSSLINMLTERKSLAKVSSTPGKTRLINHFVINSDWALVDLPGYGYAKASKSLRAEFGDIITSYILNRDQMACLFVLIDSRLEPQKIDLEFMEFLAKNRVPFRIIFTKSDKLSQAQINKNIKYYKIRLAKEWDILPESYLTSAEKGRGRDEVLSSIDEMLMDIRDDYTAADAIPDVVNSVIADTIPDVVTSVVADTIPDVVNSVVADTIPDVVDSVVADTIPDVVNSVVADTIPDVVDSVVADAIPAIHPSDTNAVDPTYLIN